MTLLVDTSSKKQEKLLKDFLQANNIIFYTEAEEDKAFGKAIAEGKKTALLSQTAKAAFLRKLKTA